MHHDPDVRPMEDLMAHLEQALMDDFIRMRGHDPAHLNVLPAAERDALLRHASAYAAAKLAEVESRAHYVQEIHGGR
ncbi:MAG TPA: hypothetical protein VKE51_12310 [Vicinamibacterales bacterium]|nr:hypothetical protein [Vicinamibacterales bacterium]